MKKKAQMDFDLESINPIALVFAVIGALISLFVMKGVEIGILWKILTPIATFVACYALVSIQFRD